MQSYKKSTKKIKLLLRLIILDYVHDFLLAAVLDLCHRLIKLTFIVFMLHL